MMGPFNATLKSVVCNTVSRAPVGCVYETIYRCRMKNIFFFGKAYCPCSTVLITANSLFCPGEGVSSNIHGSLTGFPLANIKICSMEFPAKLKSLQSGIKPVSLKWLAQVSSLCHTRILLSYTFAQDTINQCYQFLPTIMCQVLPEYETLQRAVYCPN